MASDTTVTDALSALDAAVDTVLDERRDLTGLDETALNRELAAIERASRRLRLASGRLAEQLTRLRVAAIRDAGESAGREQKRGEREVKRELEDRYGWRPSDTDDSRRLARTADTPIEPDDPVTAALRAGELSPAHAKQLTSTLELLAGDQRRRARDILLEAAQRENPRAFGRTCRRLLADCDPRESEESQRRRHQRRYGKVYTTEDGMTGVSAQVAGVDAEELATAIHAFRRRDVDGQRRTPAQVTADALVDMARAALNAGTAPTVHGVRPHVTVTIDYQTLLEGHGTAAGAWTGPIDFAEVRHLLSDCGVSRLLVGPDSLPVEAGEQVRTVPAAVRRAIAHRDGGCIAEGCDIPAGWCDVMHLDAPYRLDGRLSLDNAGLGCRTHHRRFDTGRLTLHWQAGRPVLRSRSSGRRAATLERRARERSPAEASEPPPTGARSRHGDTAVQPRSQFTGPGPQPDDPSAKPRPERRVASGGDDAGRRPPGAQPSEPSTGPTSAPGAEDAASDGPTGMPTLPGLAREAAGHYRTGPGAEPGSGRRRATWTVRA